mgnify:CR=1 FL=1
MGEQLPPQEMVDTPPLQEVRPLQEDLLRLIQNLVAPPEHLETMCLRKQQERILITEQTQELLDQQQQDREALITVKKREQQHDLEQHTHDLKAVLEQITGSLQEVTIEVKAAQEIAPAVALEATEASRVEAVTLEEDKF